MTADELETALSALREARGAVDDYRVEARIEDAIDHALAARGRVQVESDEVAEEAVDVDMVDVVDDDQGDDTDSEEPDEQAEETADEHACDVAGCDYATDTERGLAIHQGRAHSNDDDDADGADEPTTREQVLGWLDTVVDVDEPFQAGDIADDLDLHPVAVANCLGGIRDAADAPIDVAMRATSGQQAAEWRVLGRDDGDVDDADADEGGDDEDDEDDSDEDDDPDGDAGDHADDDAPDRWCGFCGAGPFAGDAGVEAHHDGEDHPGEPVAREDDPADADWVAATERRGETDDDHETLANVTVHPDNEGLRIQFGGRVGDYLDAEFATVTEDDIGYVLVAGDRDEGLTRSIQPDGRLEFRDTALDYLGVESGDEIEAIADGDQIRLLPHHTDEPFDPETARGDYQKRCPRCDIVCESSVEWDVHRTEAHDAPQSTLGLEPGEFEGIVEAADEVSDIVEAVSFGPEKTLRLLGVYGLEDVIGGGVELSDLNDFEFDGVVHDQEPADETEVDDPEPDEEPEPEPARTFNTPYAPDALQEGGS